MRKVTVTASVTAVVTFTITEDDVVNTSSSHCNFSVPHNFPASVHTDNQTLSYVGTVDEDEMLIDEELGKFESFNENVMLDKNADIDAGLGKSSHVNIHINEFKVDDLKMKEGIFRTLDTEATSGFSIDQSEDFYDDSNLGQKRQKDCNSSFKYGLVYNSSPLDDLDCPDDEKASSTQGSESKHMEELGVGGCEYHPKESINAEEAEEIQGDRNINVISRQLKNNEDGVSPKICDPVEFIQKNNAAEITRGNKKTSNKIKNNGLGESHENSIAGSDNKNGNLRIDHNSALSLKVKCDNKVDPEKCLSIPWPTSPYPPSPPKEWKENELSRILEKHRQAEKSKGNKLINKKIGKKEGVSNVNRDSTRKTSEISRMLTNNSTDDVIKLKIRDLIDKMNEIPKDILESGEGDLEDFSMTDTLDCTNDGQSESYDIFESMESLQHAPLDVKAYVSSSNLTKAKSDTTIYNQDNSSTETGDSKFKATVTADDVPMTKPLVMELEKQNDDMPSSNVFAANLNGASNKSDKTPNEIPSMSESISTTNLAELEIGNLSEVEKIWVGDNSIWQFKPITRSVSSDQTQQENRQDNCDMSPTKQLKNGAIKEPEENRNRLPFQFSCSSFTAGQFALIGGCVGPSVDFPDQDGAWDPNTRPFKSKGKISGGFRDMFNGWK